jgi:hypothetical protein
MPKLTCPLYLPTRLSWMARKCDLVRYCSKSRSAMGLPGSKKEWGSVFRDYAKAH